MEKLVCVQDFENEAVRKLDRNSWDYYASGADAQQTLRENRDDFAKWRFQPRFMVDVSCLSLRTTILGNPISFPVCVAPTAMQRMAHPLGEVANARAAAAVGTCLTLSTLSTSSIEEVTQNASEALLFFQVYVFKDRHVTVELIQRAEKAGFKALVLTIDTPRLGNRLADCRNKFQLPNHLRLVNFERTAQEATTVKSRVASGISEFTADFFNQSLTWSDITWLKSVSKLPVIVKGVLTAQDAVLSLKAGADGILVSNHGARQLDGVLSTIMALPEVVKAVAGRCEVYLDGGVTRGTDVLKALSLGARAVFVGRPALWGLAVAGQQGVETVLKIIRTELELAMMLAGVTDVQNVPRDLVRLDGTVAKL